MLQVVEHFLSIQGEGAAAGRLAVFIRLAGCNLKCQGFGVSAKSPKTGQSLRGCDTLRAVAVGHFGFLRLSADELVGTVQEYGKAAKPIVVITGGEPFIQQNRAEFARLLWLLDELGYEIHFETNATITPDFKTLAVLKKCHFAMSVKLALSGESEARRINKDAIRTIAANAKGAAFKFVLSGRADELENELAEVARIAAISPTTPVWLMPLGANKAELERHAPAVAAAAIRLGYNYTDRLHIRLWNDKEGV
ncbi:7-carboxy-7-deazaguanine synthase QueE [Campylobacter sp. 19-13652]|uniref:7-carboxy-7-deazaguanine synthase QueE n=1 Tax=Campylobacter sp. 19-13652 TaxID=2840180 RepID=UPI001C766287|nr:7-carboxy-7-deazaguanine synthase QueE [Campylobacter sp. 19-13652]BCX80132.1 7-carboxy-7-deazaguanine synthase [Campylobacter sp. 19-13652]